MTDPRSLTITVFPDSRRHGYWRFECEGYHPSGPSRAPFLDAARILLRDGWNPDTVIEMVHAWEPDAIALRATIGSAAGLTVLETRRIGPRFANWRPDPRWNADARQQMDHGLDENREPT
jgi:hypothetical protein